MADLNLKDLDLDFLMNVTQNLRNDPGRTLALFRDQQIFQDYMEAYYLARGKKLLLEADARCWVVQMEGLNIFGPKIEKMYVAHICTAGIPEILILFNRSLTLCEMAYLLTKEMDCYTIFPKGRLPIKETECYRFEGDGIDYVLASKFVKMPKKKKVLFRRMNDSEKRELLPDKPIEYDPDNPIVPLRKTPKNDFEKLMDKLNLRMEEEQRNQLR